MNGCANNSVTPVFEYTCKKRGLKFFLAQPIEKSVISETGCADHCVMCTDWCLKTHVRRCF